jgi:hypothetical protein
MSLLYGHILSPETIVQFDSYKRYIFSKTGWLENHVGLQTRVYRNGWSLVKYLVSALLAIRWLAYGRIA